MIARKIELHIENRHHIFDSWSMQGPVGIVHMGRDITLDLEVMINENELTAAGFQTADEIGQRIVAALEQAFRPLNGAAPTPPDLLARLPRRLRIPGTDGPER